MGWLLDPLHYAFFTHGLAAAVLAGGVCGAVGVYIVLRQMSYLGHGLSHSIFAGAVVSQVFHWNFYVGAGAWGFMSALVISGLARYSKTAADSVIGTVTTANFALGVALISRFHRYSQNLEAALFGDILGVTQRDVLALCGVAIFVSLVILLSYKQLLFASFDPDVATLYGVPTGRLDVLLALTLAVVIITALQVLGGTLVASVLIAPAATVRLLTNDFGRLLVGATGVGILSGLVGMYLSYYTDVASGATIALTASALYGVAFLVAGIRKAILAA